MSRSGCVAHAAQAAQKIRARVGAIGQRMSAATAPASTAAPMLCVSYRCRPINRSRSGAAPSAMNRAAWVIRGRPLRAGGVTAQPAARPARLWPSGEGISVFGPEGEADRDDQHGAERHQARQAGQAHLFSEIPLRSGKAYFLRASDVTCRARVEIRLPVE